MSTKSDFNGDNRADIPVASPWGLGILRSADGGGLTSSMMAPNGTRFGEWLLNTADNSFPTIADFDGDGRSELLVASPWGIGILEQSGSTMTAPMMAPNGTRFGEWLLNTADNRFGPVGDFDGDGLAEVLVTSPWGIGILKQSGSTMAAPMMAPNGTRFGEWLLNTADNWFGPVGDFDGDGLAEVLVTSPWGIGILKLSGDTLTTLMMAPNGTQFGGWLLNTADNRFGPVGDFDGDGLAEVLVTSPAGIGILKLSGSTMAAPMMAPNGTRFGEWLLDTADNRFGPVGDFNSDGVAELLVTSPWGIGILKLSGDTLTPLMMAPNGTQFGEWLLNTADNRLNVAADYDGDGATELLVTSPWGIGILKLSGGTLTALMMAPNGTRFGEWLLNTADNDLEVGTWAAHTVIMYHQEWPNAAPDAGAELQRRGYVLHVTDDPSIGLATLKDLQLHLKGGDRVFLYLAGHGSDPRDGALDNPDKALSLEHFVQFNCGNLYVKDFAPVCRSLGRAGIDLTVLDGGCNGGETVYNAVGEPYCALATTAICSPGGTNFPNVAHGFQEDHKPSTAGLWWGHPHLLGSWLNGQIIVACPPRSHQRLFRNDSAEFSVQSLFARTAVDTLKALDYGGWCLMCEYSRLYPHMYPANYEALDPTEQPKYVVSTADFLATMNGVMDSRRPLISQLKATLADDALMTKAGAVYAEASALAWCTLANDAAWDPFADPGKYTTQLYDLQPTSYPEVAGFGAMVAEVAASIALMEQCWEDQEALLWQIDAALDAITPLQFVHGPKPAGASWLPGTPAEYRRYNRHEQEWFGQTPTLFGQTERSLTPQRPNTPPPPIRRMGKAELRARISPDLGNNQEHFPMNDTFGDLADLIAQFKAITVTHVWHLSRFSILMSIIEDAVCKVQTDALGCINPGDLAYY